MSKEREFIYAVTRGNKILIDVKGVIAFKADQKYVNVMHVDGENLIEESLDSLQETLPSFMRIHRNCLVPKSGLIGAKKNGGNMVVTIKGSDEKFGVSRRHHAEVNRFLKNKGS